MDLQITPLNLKASIHIGACSISFLITTADGEIVDYLEKQFNYTNLYNLDGLFYI